MWLADRHKKSTNGLLLCLAHLPTPTVGHKLAAAVVQGDGSDNIRLLLHLAAAARTAAIDGHGSNYYTDSPSSAADPFIARIRSRIGRSMLAIALNFQYPAQADCIARLQCCEYVAISSHCCI